MAERTFLFTSESVSEGHPDKVSDRISDEVVDLYFAEGARADIDPWSIRVAAETLTTTNTVVDSRKDDAVGTQTYAGDRLRLLLLVQLEFSSKHPRQPVPLRFVCRFLGCFRGLNPLLG